MVDPNLQAQEDRAQADHIASLQTLAGADMTSLMARYGTRLALAGAGTGAGAVAPPLMGSLDTGPARSLFQTRAPGG